MRAKLYFFIGITVLLISANSRLDSAFAQNQDSQQPAQANIELETQWRWGEVVNIDPQSRALTIKYLDFDTDQERDLVLVTDESTIYENANSFQDIKLKDTLSADFVVSDSRNIAKNISVEKTEDTITLSGSEEGSLVPEEARAVIPPSGN